MTSKLHALAIATAVGGLSAALPASAALVTTTSKTDFDTQIGLLGYATQVTNFDGETTLPFAIADGASYDGIQLDVNTSHGSDTLTGFQISNGSTTTSASNHLGGVYQTFQTAGFFYAGDIIDLVFGEVSAFGLYVISSSAIQDGQVSVTVGGSTANLSNADAENLGNPPNAFFMGIYDDAGGTFTTAQLYSTDASGGFGLFSFYVDDIVRATPSADAPVPATLALMLGGLFGLGLARRRAKG